MVVVATAGALTLSACGGSGSDSTPSSTQDNSKLGDTGNNQNPTMSGETSHTRRGVPLCGRVATDPTRPA
jgi:hypothetical protein